MLLVDGLSKFKDEIEVRNILKSLLKDKELGDIAKKIYKEQLDSLPQTISFGENSSQWVYAFPMLKQTMDAYSISRMK